MNEQITIVVVIVLFLAAGLIVKKRGGGTIEQFSTRRNQLNWFVTAAGVSMTFIGGAALVNMAALGYTFQWYTLVDPIAFGLGIAISMVFVRFYRRDVGVTMSQLLASRDSRLSLLIGSVSSFIFLLIIAAQFVAFSKLVAPYFPGVHPDLMVVVCSLLILLYVVAGGFSAVTNTDVLQLFFIILFLLVPATYFFLQRDRLSTSVRMTNFAPMPLDLIILLGITVLYVPVSQDINIRAKSARSDTHARWGFTAGALVYILAVATCSYMGIVLAEQGVLLKDPEAAYTTFFQHFFPKLGIIGIVAGMAAIWSTLDTYLVNGITSLGQDLLKRNKRLQNMGDRKLILFSAVIVFVLAIVAGLYYNEVLGLILMALLLYISVLVPIAIGRQFGVKEGLLFAASLLTTLLILCFEVLNVNISPKAIWYPTVGIVLMILVLGFQKIVSNEKVIGS